jgi:hypothetical protein
MIKRLILGFAAVTFMSLVSPLIAQTNETTFRSTGSGLWTSSENWKYNASGIWLAPSDNAVPGDNRNTRVDVIIDGGHSLRIPDGEVVHVNSLFVQEGELFVEGTLLVGYPGQDDETADVSPSVNEREFNSALVLEQNYPNPVMTGSESTFRFYLDKEYSAVKLVLFDMLGAEIQTLYNASGPSVGWHTASVRVRDLPSGNYPVFLEVPGMPVERRLMTVVR